MPGWQTRQNVVLPSQIRPYLQKHLSEDYNKRLFGAVPISYLLLNHAEKWAKMSVFGGLITLSVKYFFAMQNNYIILAQGFLCPFFHAKPGWQHAIALSAFCFQCC